MIITQDIQMISNGFVNAFIVYGKERIFLIDSGFKSFSKSILRSIAKRQTAGFSQVTILVTHADADHVGALPDINRKIHPEILTSKIEAQAVVNGVSSRDLQPRKMLDRLFLGLTKPLFRMEPVLNIGVIDYGQTCIAGERIVVINSAGHTPGHVSYYFQDRGVLFSGDSIRLIRGKPYPSSGMNTWDERLAEESFNAQMKIRTDIIAGGHGLLKCKLMVSQKDSW